MRENEVKDAASEVDVLIVGGGPAGIQATRLIKTHDPDATIAVARPEDYSIIYCALPYAIEGLFPLNKCFKTDELVTGVGAELIREKAVKLNLNARECFFESGRRVGFDKLLIAAGAVPVKPPVPGVDLANVYTVKTGKDAEAVIAAIQGRDCDVTKKTECGGNCARAVVIGAGAIGVEQAMAYVNRGIEVHLVDIAEYPLPQLIDRDMAEPIIGELKKAGVHLHLGKGLMAFHGNKAVAQVELTDGTMIELNEGHDFATVAVGMRPDIDVFRAAGIESGKDGIIVDDRMRTSADKVWAAGDCVQYISGIDGEPLGGKLATNAVPMAKIAALDMVGKPARYKGFFNGAATVVGQLRVAGTGFTESLARSRGFDTYVSHGESATRFPMMPGAGHVKVKLVIEKGSNRILGGQIVGTDAVAERVDLVTLAAQHRMTAEDLAEFSYSSQPWQTFFPAKNAIVESAMRAVGILG